MHQCKPRQQVHVVLISGCTKEAMVNEVDERIQASLEECWFASLLNLLLCYSHCYITTAQSYDLAISEFIASVLLWKLGWYSLILLFMCIVQRISEIWCHRSAMVGSIIRIPLRWRTFGKISQLKKIIKLLYVFCNCIRRPIFTQYNYDIIRDPLRMLWIYLSRYRCY